MDSARIPTIISNVSDERVLWVPKKLFFFLFISLATSIRFAHFVAANQNNGQAMGFGMGGMNNTQTPNNTINNPQLNTGVVSAGGGDAISSLFAPPPVNAMQGMGMGMGIQSVPPQQQAGMMNPGMPHQPGMMNPGMMQPQGMMNPGMQQQGMMNPGMQQQGMMSPMGGMQQMNPQMAMMQQGMQGGTVMMGGGMQQTPQGMNPQMMQQGNMMGNQQGMYNQQPMGGMNTYGMGMNQQFR